MNLENMVKLIEFLEQPKEKMPNGYDFEMSKWYNIHLDWRVEEPMCNTSACLAGTAVALLAPEQLTHNAGANFRHIGAELLGLSLKESERMFDYSGIVVNWPEPFRLQYYRARSEEERRAVAVAYLKSEVCNYIALSNKEGNVKDGEGNAK